MANADHKKRRKVAVVDDKIDVTDVVETAARSHEAKKVRNSIYFIVRVIWWLKWGGWVTSLLFIHHYPTRIYYP